MASLKATECRKFSPNIFNKTKCQNCFRGKESHSVEALESNRATRKVSCCGYLFVAPPDWDFSLAANRNKRWQRRWFVLFDDGELAYSVDEHPETVPQRVIDMNRVLEVADAEGVTGSPFSLALCADEIHFVRGATKEEARKWFEVLSKFPRNTVCGKYKRNATFPCIKSAPVVKMEMPSRRDTVDGFTTKQVSIFDLGDDLYPTRDTTVTEKKKQEPVQNERSSEVSKILLSEDGKIDSFKSSFEKKTPCIGSLQKSSSGELKGRTEDLKPSVEKSQSKTNLSQVRGDPDGCNLECISPVACCKPVAEFVADKDESFLKKGWLVKQEEQGGVWNKHWFVLRNSGLAFYADPIAEEAGVLDGVVDLRQVHDVAPEVDSSRGFTFCVLMKDSSRLFLSAVTSKIRSQWVMAIVSAASPPTLPPSPPLARTAISRVKERARSRSTRRCFPLKEKEVKDRLEDASWAIWLDVAKFCREVEARLGQLGDGAAGCLGRVEERLHAVQEELEKAKGVLGISDHLATPPNCMLRHACEGERRRLQAEVRAAQSAADGLELQCLSLRQAHEQAERLHGSQLQLMAARVEDLTGKLLASERQVRQLRQRVAKLETRRRSSLKGKEALTLSKEYEAKLSELEGKIAALLGADEETVVEGSVLARLHTLDRKVKEAPAAVAAAAPAETPAPVAIAMPKIRLQVNESESDAENWNTLSLSASMTDLSTPSLTPGECLDELGHKVASLVAWLRTSLPSDLQLADHQQQQLELFRHLQLLMEASAALHWRTECGHYRSSVLIRVERALKELEQYMEQTGTVSLCAIAGRFLYDPPPVESNEHREEEEALVSRVEARCARASAALSEFKARFVERLCAVLLELGEEEATGPHSGKPLGQKQFLAHIGHIVTQVSQTFAAHLARSFFPCSSEAPLAQVQRELAQLSTEIQSLCSQHLSPSFFSTSAKCGVLVEYVRCAVSELARLASLSSLVTLCATDSCLPPYRIGFVSLCDPNELGMSHRSVSSLLCFKRKWKDMQCRSCTELRQEVSYLQGELEESRAGALCEKCNALKEQLEGLMVQQEVQLNEEKKQMEKELQTTKNNLKKIEHHYDGEIKKLQQEYESKLQQKNELLREDIKLRYSDEMEQLKCLCERGLSALDLAHQKIMSELEKRHQRELQELVLHQEKALADEAHATALALEAMRRTHSEELKKQVQTFKDEFVLNVNKKLETEAFRKCYESDLTKMKCEILSMAEKYSFKCLENSTLHEKLEIVNQQLKSTTTQVVELLAKNRQLQARLTSASIQEESIFSNL